MDTNACPDKLVAEADRLCDLGLYLQVQSLLPSLLAHPSLRGRLIGLRAQAHLGAQRRSESEVIRMWRANPDAPRTAISYLRALTYRRGPYQAWRQLDKYRLNEEECGECDADFHSLRAYLLGCFRDFREARAAYDEARRLAPITPWPLVEWCYVCECADSYQEGLASVEEALVLSPAYRPAIQARVRLLTLTGRDDEALAFLTETSRAAESGALNAQLLEMQIEKGLCDEALNTLDRCAATYPLADKAIKTWLAAQRTDIALRLGRVEEARRHVGEVDSDFYRQIAERLDAADASGRRVLLPVGFVRQHHLTCAPATLAALANYWSHPADHLDIAEQICYDGTHNHSERQWAEDQGFVGCEFTATWDSARALIDAGVPFTLTTSWTGGAHLQAVIGYDELRGSLLIRDPFKRIHGEFDASGLFEVQRSTGPRGMLLLPAAEAHRVEGIDLPETALWNGYHRVMTALKIHDREAAKAAAGALEAEAPAHRLSISARRALAMYDGDETAILKANDELLALFPQDGNLQLSKAASLSLLASRAEQVDWLAPLATPANAEPLTLVRYGQLLGQDGRDSAQAAQLVRHALDRRPTDASAWSAYASLLWQLTERENALKHYRIAACLQDTCEDYAIAYFRACHFVRQTDTGLAFLRERVERLGRKSPFPLITLFGQLEMLEQTDEAFRLLDKAIEESAENGDLLLFAGEAKLRYGHAAEAANLLERARGKTRQAACLRLQAQIAQANADLAGALALAREASTLEPFNLQQHRQVTALLSRNEGRAQAIAYLREVTQKFDHHFGLHQLLIEWLADEPHSEAEAVLRHLIDINPGSDWARRELAINLARQHRYDEALALMETAREMAKAETYTYSTLGFIHLRRGNASEAREQLRAALALSIDNDYALNALIESGTTLAQRQEDLDFIRQELVRQVTLGDSLLSFQDAAQRTLASDELLQVLRDAWRERPDLWQSWVALGAQLTDMARTDEALELIGQAIERFPLLPRLRLEQGRALGLQGKREAARESYKQVLQINPQWTWAVRLFVNTVLDEGGNFERALAVLNAALARNPENAELLALRAWVLWRQGERESALDQLPQAIVLDPRANWMWNTLKIVANESDDRELPRRIADELIAKRPGDVWSWIRSAEHAAGQEQAIAAIERALELEPRSVAAFETRLNLLMQAGRLDDVSAALRNPPWAEVPLAIRAYGARAARARGDLNEAFLQLNALVDEDTNNYAIWELLADVCDQSDRDKPYLEAASNLVRLAPNYYKAHGYLAHALQKSEDHQRAKEHFARSFQLDATYTFAGYNLADYYLDDGQLREAETTVTALGLQGHNLLVVARRVRLEGLKNNKEAACGALREILRGEESDWPVKTAIGAFRKAGWAERLEQEIAACFAAGSCAPTALRHWIEQQGRGFLPGSFYRDIKRALANDPHNTLMRGLLDYAGARTDVRLLNQLLKHHRPILLEDAQCWALVSYGLLGAGHHARVVDWMKDWRAKPDIPAYALDNLAVALRTLGRHSEARDASLRSLEQEPENPDALIWLAVDAARDDRPQELAQLLEKIGKAQVRPFFRNLLSAVQAYHRGVRENDCSKTLIGFGELKTAKKQSIVLRQLMQVLGGRMVLRHTPLILRPLRWLQFVLI